MKTKAEVRVTLHKPRTTWSHGLWGRGEEGSPPEPWREPGPAHTPPLDFCPPGLQADTLLLFEGTSDLITCHNNSSHLMRLCWSTNEPSGCSLWGQFCGWPLDFVAMIFTQLYAQIGWEYTAVNTFTYTSRDHVVTGNSMSLSEIIFKFTHFETLPFMKYHYGSIFQLSRIQYDKFYVEKAPDFRKDSTRCILLKGIHCTTFSSLTSPWWFGFVL